MRSFGLRTGPKTNGLFHKLKETEAKVVHLKTGKSRHVTRIKERGTEQTVPRVLGRTIPIDTLILTYVLPKL